MNLGSDFDLSAEVSRRQSTPLLTAGSLERDDAEEKIDAGGGGTVRGHAVPEEVHRLLCISFDQSSYPYRNSSTVLDT